MRVCRRALALPGADVADSGVPSGGPSSNRLKGLTEFLEEHAFQLRTGRTRAECGEVGLARNDLVTDRSQSLRPPSSNALRHPARRTTSADGVSRDVEAEKSSLFLGTGTGEHDAADRTVAWWERTGLFLCVGAQGRIWPVLHYEIRDDAAKQPY